MNCSAARASTGQAFSKCMHGLLPLPCSRQLPHGPASAQCVTTLRKHDSDPSQGGCPARKHLPPRTGIGANRFITCHAYLDVLRRGVHLDFCRHRGFGCKVSLCLRHVEKHTQAAPNRVMCALKVGTDQASEGTSQRFVPPLARCREHFRSQNRVHQALMALRGRAA